MNDTYPPFPLHASLVTASPLTGIRTASVGEIERVRKMFPMYRNPTDESVTAGDDRRLPPELRGRMTGEKETPRRNSCVFDNPRLLILPWVRIPNLGSHILAIVRRRL